MDTEHVTSVRRKGIFSQLYTALDIYLKYYKLDNNIDF